MGGLYIRYSEEGTGRDHSPARPLLAVPNVTAHPSTTSVSTSYYSMRHYCLWSLKGSVFKSCCHWFVATGDIVSVETVVVPLVKGRARPERTAWTESVDADTSYVFALRVFYSKSVVAAGASATSRRTSNASTVPTAPRLQFIGNNRAPAAF